MKSQRVWLRFGDSLNQSVFDPYVVLGSDDFDEVLRQGGQLERQDYARFSPDRLLASPDVSEHVKTLIRELVRSR